MCHICVSRVEKNMKCVGGRLSKPKHANYIVCSGKHGQERQVNSLMALQSNFLALERKTRPAGSAMVGTQTVR